MFETILMSPSNSLVELITRGFMCVVDTDLGLAEDIQTILFDCDLSGFSSVFLPLTNHKPLNQVLYSVSLEL